MQQAHFNIGGIILPLLYIFLPLILGWIHTSIKHLKKGEKVEVFLVYYLVVGVGLQGLIASYMQIFHSELVAQYVGWANTPFLKEVGMANLSFAILGILSIWIKGLWRTAVAIGYGLLLWFAAIGHIVNFIQEGTISLGNTGPTLWSDILVPLALFILLAMRENRDKK